MYVISIFLQNHCYYAMNIWYLNYDYYYYSRFILRCVFLHLFISKQKTKWNWIDWKKKIEWSSNSEKKSNSRKYWNCLLQLHQIETLKISFLSFYRISIPYFDKYAEQRARITQIFRSMKTVTMYCFLYSC